MSISTVTNLPQADVEVTFTGLMLMRFEKSGQLFEAGVHDRTGDHHLRLSVELRERATEKVLERWDSQEPLTEDVCLDVQNPQQQGLSVYATDEPLNRENPSPSQQKDFRWTMDFPRFHERELEVDESGVTPTIRLNHGVFYTHKLFRPNTPLHLLRDKPFSPQAIPPGISAATRPNALLMHDIAAVIGANVYLNDAESKLSVKQGNRELLPDLTKPKSGQYYQVVFNNNCSEDVGKTYPKMTSDLPIYYEVIHGVLEEEQLELSYLVQTGDEYPCIPIFWWDWISGLWRR